MIESWLINKTEREGLLYQNLVWLKGRFSLIIHCWRFLFRRRKIEKYLNNHDFVRVQLGSGGQILEDFLNTDLFGDVPVDITRKLPFPDSSVNIFFSNHLFEHVGYRHARKHLMEMYRCLRDDGVCILAMPSLEKIVNILFQSGNDQERNEYIAQHESCVGMKLVASTLLNRIMHANYGHRWLHDYESLEQLASAAGFTRTYKIPLSKIPDAEVRKNLQTREGTWPYETEIFILCKNGEIHLGG